MFKPILLIAALGVATTGAAAQAANKPIIYVGNSFGDDVTSIDAATGKVVATTKVGRTVHAICAEGDRRKAFGLA